MRALILFAFICLGKVVGAQDSIMVWKESKPLQWMDFNGQVHDTAKYDAEVFAEVRYQYSFSNVKDFSFNVFAIVNKKTSWTKKHKQSEELLRHEQLHFDIAELYARKLKETFERYRYTNNYHHEILKIFTTLKSEYHLTQKRCDEETNHSLNKLKQTEWEDYVKHELQAAKGRLYELVAKSNK